MKEGLSHDRGLYARCFEELFDLANSDATSTSRFSFSVSVFEIYNEQIRDLLWETESNLPKINMGSHESITELEQERADNPLEFSRGSSKTLMIVTICPSAENLSETISCLNYAARARNTVPSLGNRDTIKKWRDVASDARKELLEKERENQNLKQESENTMLVEKHRLEKEQNSQLRTQIAQLLQLDQEQKLQMQKQDSTIQNLQAKITDLESQVSESDTTRAGDALPKAAESTVESSSVTKKLEEELKKRDALIERLHEENEKLFDRLTERSMAVSTQVSSPSSRASPNVQPASVNRNNRAEAAALPSTANKNEGAITVVKTGSELAKTTPAGEYLTAALNDFDPEDYEGLAAIADGANKLLMLVLAAVIKAGASREHEILAEIRDSKMESRRVMDTMLVSRVRILYIRSLLARSPELQTIRVEVKALAEEAAQDSGRQQVTGVKLREMQDEAKSFAIGNKSLAALFVHTPAGELQRQIRLWLAENFEFLSVTADDVSGGTTGQLELLSTAIMDGWMAGLGAAVPPHTDALGRLLSEYAKRVYTSQMQHMKDIAGTLAAEEAEDAGQVAKLRSALESVDHKRRKILQQMKSDAALLNLEEGSSPIQNPSTAAEDSRLASLLSLDGILKQVKDITRQASVHVLSKSKKTALLEALDELTERMPSLLDIDHPCAQREIATARQLVETIPEQENNNLLEYSHGRRPSFESISSGETDVSQWNVLQFNTGSSAPFIIKCGGNTNSELVIKADARVQEPKGGELVKVVPRPSVLVNMSLEEMKQMFAQLPEALSVLALAKTGDATRARYSRLYKTLAMKVPALRDVVADLEKDT
ncbi:hypothetical protein HID58_050442 [Brassica napus]|uniref:Kinesin motor domain-containing protein n=1 Tax=Brassica napus TaxID=3708 RepID=A0ABQ8A6K7_BRANA|nr:hypothetical protein HID58_050442 [Brassica napus]